MQTPAHVQQVAANLHTDAGLIANTPAPLPPHFPDPNADPIALLEQALRDKDEIIADQHRELTAWRTQLEAALERIKSMEAANVNA